VAGVSQALLGLKGKYDAIEEKAFHKDPTFHKVINHVWLRHPAKRSLEPDISDGQRIQGTMRHCHYLYCVLMESGC
jgi:hypothetical protein